MIVVVMLVGFKVRRLVSLLLAIMEDAMDSIVSDLITAAFGATLARRSGDVALDPQGIDTCETDGNNRVDGPGRGVRFSPSAPFFRTQ